MNFWKHSLRACADGEWHDTKTEPDLKLIGTLWCNWKGWLETGGPGYLEGGKIHWLYPQAHGPDHTLVRITEAGQAKLHELEGSDQ